MEAEYCWVITVWYYYESDPALESIWINEQQARKHFDELVSVYSKGTVFINKWKLKGETNDD
jgi:hypothetical protein